MIINDINLEKREFVTDLDRNIFLLPKEILEKYHVTPAKPEENESNIITETPPLSEEIIQKYEHETVFLFNGKGMYEIPCKIAIKNILSKRMRDYFTQYMYYRKWVDIDPAEVSMLSLFLYDLAKSVKKSKEEPEVTGYSATVSGASKANWAHQSTSSQKLRSSNSSRTEEKSRAASAHAEIANKVEKPMNAVAQDKIELSGTAQRELHARRGPDTDERVGRRESHDGRPAPERGELGGEAKGKDDSGFFSRFDKLFKGMSDISGNGKGDGYNITDKLNAQEQEWLRQFNQENNRRESGGGDGVGHLIDCGVAVGGHTAEGTVLGAVAGATVGAIITAPAGELGGIGPGVGAQAGAIVGTGVGFMLGLGEISTHYHPSTFINAQPH